MDETDYHAPIGDPYGQQWNALSAWFLGPRAENCDVYKEIWNELLDTHAECRQNFYPTDPAYVTHAMKSSDEYASEIKDLRDTLHKMNDELREHSVPFFTPRYQALMLRDVTMPSLLGYQMAMLHCQNNVDTACSSVTTVYEKAVGLQLCDMLGYNIETVHNKPKSWGHITCGGSVANIESVWASRNMKFSAVSLKCAITHADCNILRHDERTKAEGFKVKVLAKCHNEDSKYVMTEKSIAECSTRELLNLDVDEFCNLTKRLAKEVGLRDERLDKFTAWVEANNYTTLGDRTFMEKHDIKPAVYTAPLNCHYSWPKSGTLLGLGSSALVPIPLDDDFRQDVSVLEERLKEYANADIPVLSATAVIGSTEESAVDPILKMWELRNKMKTEFGINFALLADGGWGGYMKTMLIGKHVKERVSYKPDFVPFMGLSDYVEEQYSNIQLADTITINPHKSGFCPYPAGALCYRNGAMRYFIAILHPAVYHGEDDHAMGVYGIEGSKPGAVPAGVLASHRVIGLDIYGYGRILGQCQTTCKMFYCLWLTLARPNDPYICLPIQTLPAKYMRPVYPESSITVAEHLIKNRIIGKSMAEVFMDEEAMELLRAVGPDTLINTFVVNPKDKDGNINADVKRSNDLQKSLSDALNVYVGKCNERVPIILMQSGLNTNHGHALKSYKRRLGLDADDTALNVMINTAMNPWQWNASIADLGEIFRTHILNCMGQLDDGAYKHEFVICGDMNEDKELFAELIPDFNVPARQYHLIVKLKVTTFSGTFQPGLCIRSVSKIDLHKFVGGTDAVEFEMYDPCCGTETVMGRTDMKVVDMPRFMHFDTAYGEYMSRRTYFMYGDQGRTYMSHCIKSKPDFMQVVELNEPPYGLCDELISLGVKAKLPELGGQPKVIDDDIADPLDGSTFRMHYKGREYADCKSTVSCKRTVIFKPLH